MFINAYELLIYYGMDSNVIATCIRWGIFPQLCLVRGLRSLGALVYHCTNHIHLLPWWPEATWAIYSWRRLCL